MMYAKTSETRFVCEKVRLRDGGSGCEMYEGETEMGNWERGEKIMSLESQSETGLRPIQKQSFTKLKTSLS